MKYYHGLIVCCYYIVLAYEIEQKEEEEKMFGVRTQVVNILILYEGSFSTTKHDFSYTMKKKEYS